eukprot:3893057-Heterocapsa_arctica.AAC.1
MGSTPIGPWCYDISRLVLTASQEPSRPWALLPRPPPPEWPRLRLPPRRPLGPALFRPTDAFWQRLARHPRLGRRCASFTRPVSRPALTFAYQGHPHRGTYGTLGRAAVGHESLSGPTPRGSPRRAL